MAKNIVICSDGTGNTAVKGRGTNVFKLYESVDVVCHQGGASDAPGREQIAIYDDGVGTQSLKIVRALAGAFGFGLARNVRQLYAELVRCYSVGDDIYLFGFSRGAFTARTLAGFINDAGILDPSDLTSGELSAKVGELYRAYRKRRPAVLELLVTPFSNGLRWLWRRLTGARTEYKFHIEGSEKRKKNGEGDRRFVKFVGVWDTVDAVGFPMPGIAGFWNMAVHRFKFTDRNLPVCVERACHALAIDEERASFALTLWTHDPERTEQVWFAGVHSNVGGGYPKQGMSLVALDWMMDRAVEASAGELRLSEALRKQYREASNVGDYLYDSRSGPAIYYRYKPRDIRALCDQAGTPVRIHPSAIDRIRRRPRGYAPGSIPSSFEVSGSRFGEASKALLQEPPPKGSAKVPPEFSGARDFWRWWRQTVQVGFYIAQAVVVYLAWTNSPVPPEELPRAPVAEPGVAVATMLPAGDGAGTTASRAKDASFVGRAAAWWSDALSKERLVPWLMGVAENLTAPVPGDFVQERLVQPMFAYPKIGLLFLLLFPVFFGLGLIGRLRQAAINSNRWRHVEVVTTDSS